MNKTSIKNFATWARKKLIADITYKASLMGITDQGIKSALPQSMLGEEAYDIGTKEPYVISGDAVRQRAHLARLISDRAKGSDYQTAFNSVVEEVAYTWFNRLIAIRFMEVNDYMPDHIRVLSSENGSKLEPDMVTTPFDTELEFTEKEKQQIIQLKNDNSVDELFQMLFIKECNSLNQYLPRLFEKTADYTELLLNVSVTDKEGVVYHLVHDIEEQDFDINNIGEDGRPTGQVEIIGWLYQYYNAELKDETFAFLKKNKKITKERIPSATQLFTPDWIVRYMVENSLGRVWLNGHPNDELKKNWIYYIDEAKQKPEVEAKLQEEREEYKKLRPEDLTLMDPSMGSGHILVYGFDVLMQIYTSVGYSERDAAQSILKNNLYGLDIDERAFQLAYFAVMMKGRQYDRRILTRGIEPHVYAIEESNDINREHLKFLGNLQDEQTRKKNQKELVCLLDRFRDAKIYGSIIKVEGYDFDALTKYVHATETEKQISLETLGLQETISEIQSTLCICKTMQDKYLTVVTNPPYMGANNMNATLSNYIKTNYPDVKSDMSTVFMSLSSFMCLEKGLISMINIPVWMFITSYQNFRAKLLSQETIVNLIHPGRGIFGSDFGTTTFVLANHKIDNYRAYYFRLFEKQGDVLSNEDRKKAFLLRKGQYIENQENFSLLPGYPLAYWTNQNMFKAFASAVPLEKLADVKVGLQTGDNERFLKLWFEVPYDKITFNSLDGKEVEWIPYNKGGDYRKWFGNQYFIVNWTASGKSIKDYHGSYARNTNFYFQSGFSWSDVSSGRMSVRYWPKGCIFDTCAPTFFSEKYGYELLALANSRIGQYLMDILSPTIHYTAGSMQKFPIWLEKLSMGDEAKECIEISKADYDSSEISWNFRTGWWTANHVLSVQDAWDQWKALCDKRIDKQKSLEEKINSYYISAYGLQDSLTPNISRNDISLTVADKQRDVKALLSYTVGCLLGRYSLDVDGLAYAGGDWDASKYSTFIPDVDNVIPITDEDYFDDDIVGLLIQWLKKVYGEDTLEENLDFIAKALGNKGNTSREIIRNYFLTDFFKDHCQTYSVTGSGKRPIYWLYDSGKQNGFKALIYMHRYNEDTTGVVRVKYLHRMEQIYMSEIDRMQDMMDHSKSAHDVSVASKRKEKLQKQLKECKDYDEKISHLALDRIAIDLDDGVKVNYRKVQTGSDGKFYEVLADSKNIMKKE
ncbi:BREX-1 system adenine-specific DNA-methyltransferase PglX [Lactimicrobium massiliense]|uniref:BREX-1 system adenine-specific DNA-methyltransferase PglX n=1 Tax=Lactimicrobium massiliense TaxID=2161814 RepID=UPI000D55B800|nr:BREX-1 system adenine-specific DNA-methyltransferase PglX [Lactimicrobium massiliense]